MAEEGPVGQGPGGSPDDEQFVLAAVGQLHDFFFCVGGDAHQGVDLHAQPRTERSGRSQHLGGGSPGVFDLWRLQHHALSLWTIDDVQRQRRATRASQE